MRRRPSVPAGRPHSLVWAQGLACGMAAALMPSVALVIAVLLGPGLVAIAMDHEPGKPVARAVVLCGLAACVEPVRALWASGHGLDIGMAVIGDPRVVGTAWSAAAGAWLLAEAAPIAVRMILEAASIARATRLRAARTKLAEEWGLPPSEGT
jgi:hypothetical protein